MRVSHHSVPLYIDWIECLSRLVRPAAAALERTLAGLADEVVTKLWALQDQLMFKYADGQLHPTDTRFGTMATTAFDSSWDEGLGHVTATLTEGAKATTNEAVVEENAA